MAKQLVSFMGALLPTSSPARIAATLASAVSMAAEE